MTQFYIIDDFPDNQTTFDLRFNTEEAYNAGDILFIGKVI